MLNLTVDGELQRRLLVDALEAQQQASVSPTATQAIRSLLDQLQPVPATKQPGVYLTYEEVAPYGLPPGNYDTEDSVVKHIRSHPDLPALLATADPYGRLVAGSAADSGDLTDTFSDEDDDPALFDLHLMFTNQTADVSADTSLDIQFTAPLTGDQAEALMLQVGQHVRDYLREALPCVPGLPAVQDITLCH